PAGLNSQTTTSAPLSPFVWGAKNIGDQTSSSNTSDERKLTPATAAWSCSAVIGRVSIEPTYNTGNPAASASSTEIASGPAAVMRARTREAPAACNDTCRQQNGTISRSVSAASPAACSAASSNTGWIPNPPSSTPSGTAM